MYDFHQRRDDPIYTDYVIYSADVPVFRSDDNFLLEESYAVSIITSPVVNAKHVQIDRRSEILPAMESRIAKVLSVGLLHGHHTIFLGAWGCGAFGADPSEIAKLFPNFDLESLNGAPALNVLNGAPCPERRQRRRRKAIEPFEILRAGYLNNWNWLLIDG